MKNENVSISIENERTRPVSNGMKNFSLKTSWVVIAIILVIIFGWIATLYVGRFADQRERKALLTRVEITARAIGVNDIHLLTGTADDITNPQYIALKHTLTEIKNAQSDVRFVYLMGYRGDSVNIQSGDKLFFYLDSEYPSSAGYSAPGDIYNETDQVQLDAFKNGNAIIEGPYKDSFGEWVSGFAPIYDHETGKVLALVGTDISAKIWKETIWEAESIPILITLFLTSILLAYYFVGRNRARYIIQIEKSEMEAEEQRDRLRTLYEISTRKKMNIADQIRAALKTGNEKMYTKMAMLNRIEGDKFTVLHCVVPKETLHEGDTFLLHETYCDITVKKDDVVAISAMGASEYKAHVCYTKFKLESYIGVPIKVSGGLFGTLTFLAPDPHRPEFTESDKDFVRLMGAWISATLERQEIDKMKSEFVSVASHQLRTPLTGIKWFSELLLRGKAGAVSADQKDFLEQIHVSNERMIKLVEDLLNVSRIETGTKFEIVKKPTDIVSIVDSLATDLAGLAHQHKVEIKKSENFPKTLTLAIDADKIRQVFGNLMSNAVKYSHEGGMVTLGFEEKGTMVIFSITDTGLGIPKSAESHVFEKFFRAENVQTHETEGTGLGLYIARAIAEGHGGSLTFTSVENQGTTFFVSLSRD